MRTSPLFTTAHWRKSSYSNGGDGNCVEVAAGIPGVLPVRDSKDPQGPALLFQPTAWTAFITAIKQGELNDDPTA